MTPAPTQSDASRWEEMAKRILDNLDSAHGEETFVSPSYAYYADAVRAVASAFAQVAAEVREAALEEAAVESESWFEMFKFESFALDDMRRCANPNQIAARIRALKCPTKLSDGSDQ